MRICIKYRNNNKLVKDTRLLKYDYEARKNYLNKIALLEKRLLWDSSIYVKALTIWELIDLKASFD